MLMMMNKLEPSSSARFSSSYYSSLNLVTTATKEAAEGASSPACRLQPPASREITVCKDRNYKSPFVER